MDLIEQLQRLGDSEIDDLSVAHDALSEIVQLRLYVAELSEHLDSLQNRYAQATAEAEAYRAELERLRDVVSEIDASLIDVVLDA